MPFAARRSRDALIGRQKLGVEQRCSRRFGLHFGAFCTRALTDKRKRVLRYETLAPMAHRDAADILVQKLAAAGHKGPVQSRVTFRTLVNEWQATVLPMYKLNTEESSAHRGEALVAAIRRYGPL